MFWARVLWWRWMALNEIQERALVKTLFLALSQRTWESYQGFCPCASPWKQCFLFLAISCSTILYYFIQKPPFPCFESSGLFQGCSFVLLPISSLSGARAARGRHTIYDSITFILLSLLRWWRVLGTNTSVLFIKQLKMLFFSLLSEPQLACN